MALGLIKLATNILLTNPKARKVAGKVIKKAYSKAKPVIKKNTEIIKAKIKDNLKNQ